jgi:prevent-host-death family protein
MNGSVRELKARLSRYLRRVQQGEEIVITHRGQPVGRILPIVQEQATTEADVVQRATLGAPDSWWEPPGRAKSHPAPPGREDARGHRARDSARTTTPVLLPPSRRVPFMITRVVTP